MAPGGPGPLATPPTTGHLPEHGADGDTCAFCMRLGDPEPYDPPSGKLGVGHLLGPFALSSGNPRFVHYPCALWSPKVIEEEATGLVESSLLKEINRGKQMKCSFCGRPGATTGCRLPQAQCARIYHYPCARSAGCEFDLDWMITCPKHKGGSGVATVERKPAQRRPRAEPTRAEIEVGEKLDGWKRHRKASAEDDDEAFFREKERKRFERDVGLLKPLKLGSAAPADGSVAATGAAAFASTGAVASAGVEGWESVAGLQSHVAALKEMVMLPLQYPEVVQALGITPPRGVLLHGEPGTGKTLVVRALAAACARGPHPVAFFSRKGADCLGKYSGEAERTLRLLFEDAARQQPSIVFFDEIDGLVPARGHREGTQDQMHASVVTTLLALMDGVSDRGLVVVLGATNRPESVDPALRRPGRFDRELHFPLPTPSQRAEILALHTRGWSPQPSDRVVRAVAAATSGFAGADLRSLCSEAVLAALQRRDPRVLARLVRAARTAKVAAAAAAKEAAVKEAAAKEAEAEVQLEGVTGEERAGGEEGAAPAGGGGSSGADGSRPPQADGCDGAADGAQEDEEMLVDAELEGAAAVTGGGGTTAGQPSGGGGEEEDAAAGGVGGQPDEPAVERDPLGDLVVSVSDWKAAIEAMPPPCSRRSATFSTMDGGSGARPLPHHMVPLLGPHVVAAVTELRALRSAGAALPSAAAAALDAVLAHRGPPPGQGEGGVGAALEDALCRAGAFASSSVDGGAVAGEGIMGGGEELRASGLSAADVLRLDRGDGFDDDDGGAALENQLRAARRRCSILLAGKGDQGQGAVASAVAHLMEGAAVINFGLPSLLVDGDGDVSKGVARVLREALLRAPAASAATVLVMPRIDAWVGEVEVVLEDEKREGEEGEEEEGEDPTNSQPFPSRGDGAELAECDAPPERVTIVASPAWEAFTQTLNLIPLSRAVVLLATSACPLDDLPYEVVELFSPLYPDEPPPRKEGGPGEAARPHQPGVGLGGYLVAEADRPEGAVLRLMVDRAVGGAVALAGAEELAEQAAAIERHRRAAAGKAAAVLRPGAFVGGKGPRRGDAGYEASGGVTPGLPVRDPDEEAAWNGLSKELKQVGDILLSDRRYTMLIDSQHSVQQRAAAAGRASTGGGGDNAQAGGDWTAGGSGIPLEDIATHAGRAPSPAALLSRLQREVFAVLQHERRHRQRAKLMQLGRGISGGAEYSPVEAAGSAVLDVIASICFQISRRYEGVLNPKKKKEPPGATGGGGDAAPATAIARESASPRGGGSVEGPGSGGDEQTLAAAKGAGAGASSPGRGSGLPSAPDAAALESLLQGCRPGLQRGGTSVLLRALGEGAVALEQVEMGRAAVLGAFREVFRRARGALAGGGEPGEDTLDTGAAPLDGWGGGMALYKSAREMALREVRGAWPSQAGGSKP